MLKHVWFLYRFGQPIFVFPSFGFDFNSVHLNGDGIELFQNICAAQISRKKSLRRVEVYTVCHWGISQAHCPLAWGRASRSHAGNGLVNWQRALDPIQTVESPRLIHSLSNGDSTRPLAQQRCVVLPTCLTGSWFETFLVFPHVGKSNPNWLIFSEGLKPPTSWSWNWQIYSATAGTLYTEGTFRHRDDLLSSHLITACAIQTKTIQTMLGLETGCHSHRRARTLTQRTMSFQPCKFGIFRAETLPVS